MTNGKNANERALVALGIAYTALQEIALDRGPLAAKYGQDIDVQATAHKAIREIREALEGKE